MRWVGAICAVLAIFTAESAAGQIYPYLATVPVPNLIAPGPQAVPGEPQGLAFDTVGNRLLVAEGANQIVQIFDGTSLAPLTVIGEAGVTAADAGHLSDPGGVAVDSARGRILIADTGNDRVQIFDAVHVTPIATLGVSGVSGTDDGHLSGPAGIAIDTVNARILVADTANHRIQLFDADSFAFIATIGVTGTPGTDNAHLSAPQAVAVDATTGHLLVADTGNNRIQIFNAQSAAYLATIGQTGSVSGLGVDVGGRRIFAATPAAFDIAVFDADSLAPVATLGLVGSFGIDNAHFLAPGGLAFDSATGRIFAGDAMFDRVQIFGRPSSLFAAVAPDGRAVAVDRPASIFATILNGAATALDNCRISLPNNAPTGLTLSFQTTDPATNLTTGGPNQPVTIPPRAGQSFVLTLGAATPVSALGQSFLFTCDGTTPAPIFSGINTADVTVSAAPTADVIAASATPGGAGVIDVPDTINPFAAFPIAAFNLGQSELLQVTADSGSFLPATGFKLTLPLTVLICQTNPFSGQCLAAPAATIMANFPSGGTATFTVFVSATGAAIPNALNEPRLFLRFSQPVAGAPAISVGNTSVAIATVHGP
jgi:DNA-binding beta-propeller fold protein YncE